MIVRLVARALEAPLVVKEPFARLDAIVVLGSPLGPDDTLTDVLAERVRATVALYLAGGAPQVIATGGITRGASRAEADVLADALRSAGVPPSSLVIERASLTTADNARLTATLLPRGTRVWLVTQPFHGRRAARLFRAAGLDPHIWHIADSLEYADRPRAVRWLVREYAAWARLLVSGGQ